MPTRSISEGYQGSLDAKYRSRTGREGHESGSTHRTPEGGDVRKKVAEKLSERKKVLPLVKCSLWEGWCPWSFKFML